MPAAASGLTTPPDLFTFNSMADRALGLVFGVHQSWRGTVELSER